MLSQRAIRLLEEYCASATPSAWLFSGVPALAPVHTLGAKHIQTLLRQSWHTQKRLDT
jgi:hypothetical protein